MTKTYATVGVDRIQIYLGRSRHLWGRRGASEELVRLTTLPGSPGAEGLSEDELVVAQILKRYPHVQVNQEGLDIDGVVSLESTYDGFSYEIVQAAEALAKAIRDRLPALTVTTRSITSAEPYVKLIDTSQYATWTTQTWYPLANEYPPVRPCDECNISPATRTFQQVTGATGAEALRLCSDCFTRWGRSDRWRNRTLAAAPIHSDDKRRYPSRFTSETWLLRRLAEAGEGDALKFVQDFETLGNQTRPASDGEAPALRGRTHQGNHTALVFADGNGMGGLFSKAIAEAAAGNTTEPVRGRSKAIKQATADALLAATQSILYPTDEYCPVIPHVFGGDDLLVSVAADRAWQFLVEFMTSLRGDGASGPFPDLGVSMSAAMVICKAEYPLGNQVELAEGLLARAKASVRGDGWSFTWVDVTADGADLDSHRAWRSEQLVERQAAIAHLRGVMSAHGESALGSVLAADPASRGLQLAHLSRRMEGVAGFLELVGLHDPNTITDEQVALIEEMQSIGRWWR